MLFLIRGGGGGGGRWGEHGSCRSWKTGKSWNLNYHFSRVEKSRFFVAVLYVLTVGKVMGF